jgi:hypothetical protein
MALRAGCETRVIHERWRPCRADGMTRTAGVGCHRSNLMRLGTGKRPTDGIFPIMASHTTGTRRYPCVCKLGRLPGIRGVTRVASGVIRRGDVSGSFTPSILTIMTSRASFTRGLCSIMSEGGWKPSGRGMTNITLHTWGYRYMV